MAARLPGVVLLGVPDPPSRDHPLLHISNLGEVLMNRLPAVLLSLLVLALVAPKLAQFAQAAVPLLASALILLFAVRLFLPPQRRRR